MKKILFSTLLSVASLCAFDTRTHVWIAQEIINDLEDGSVTISPFGDFTVDPSVVSAILEHPRVFRMGNIGPDGFPDVVGGQVTVHPGLEDGYIDDDTQTLVHGWKSDEWFRWVLTHAQTPEQKAFAYGFLAHGASDTFAHSYVNMYAGDIFDMNDGETDVEKRHIFLEKYISDRLPPYTDAAGNDLGEAYELVAVDDELPVTYIKNTLIMNEQSARQYALASSANYLAKMYAFRQKIAALDDDTESTVDADRDDADKECSDSFWYPGKYFFSVFASKGDACEQKSFLETKRAELSQLKNSYGIERYSFKKAWLAQIDHAIDEYVKTSSRMSRNFMQAGAPTYSELTDWIDCYGSSFTDPTTLGAKSVEGSCSLSKKLKDELGFLDDVKPRDDFTRLSALKNDVHALSKGLGSEIVDLIGIAALEIVTVKDRDVSHDSLNEQFGSDGSDKHLLLIGDIAERVEAEMHLTNNRLDPEAFAPLQNALVLSKLSLLSREQINELIRRSSAAETFRYLSDGTSSFNLLFNSIKTIDGNQQWRYQAPPYPRAEGFKDTRPHFYGYDSNATHGFRFFETDTLRLNLFDKIFKGPLNLGMQQPNLIGMSTVLPAGYPYIACGDDPFPSSGNDSLCSTSAPANGDRNDTNRTDTGTPSGSGDDTDEWESLLAGLKALVMEYYYRIIGEENILATTETNDSIKIITTVPDDGIIF